MRAKVLKEIQRRVEMYARRADLATLALMTLLKEHFAAVQDFTLASAPEGVFTQTFTRQILKGTTQRCTEAYPVVTALYEAHPALAQGETEFLGSRNAWSSGGTRMLTCLKNSLRTNLVRRLRSFARGYAEAHGLTQQAARRLQGMLVWGTPEGVLPGKEAELMEERGGGEDPLRGPSSSPAWQPHLGMVRLHRRVLGFATPTHGAGEHEFRTAYELEDSEKDPHLERILVYFAFQLRERERLGLELFNLCPLHRLRMHHLTIDTHVLYGIARDAGIVDKKCREATFLALRDAHWSSLFRISKLAMTGRTFTCTVATDGVSLSVYFERPRAEAGEQGEAQEAEPKRKKRKGKKVAEEAPAPPPPEDFSDALVLGLDPGRSNLFTIALPVGEGRFERLGLSRRQYYTDAGIYGAERRTWCWQAALKPSLMALSLASPKGLALESHWQFVETYLAHREALWKEYSKARWARQRLRLYALKRSALDGFFNRVQERCEQVAPGKRVVTAYGAAGFTATAKREPSVPVAWAKEAYAKRFEVRLVDEYRTSRVHWRDGRLLAAVWSEAQERRVRGLLWCESTIRGASKLVDRDLNAAINIRRCLLSAARPAALCRHACAGQRLPVQAPIGHRLRA